MSKPTTLRIDDVEYVRADSVAPQAAGDIKIVILPRGWVAIGRFSQEGPNCKLFNAHTIRRWGTTKGLGQLATEGKLKDTILDPCPLGIEFHELTIIAKINCSEDVWKSMI